MQKRSQRTKVLVNTVLASTIFVTQLAQATILTPNTVFTTIQVTNGQSENTLQLPPNSQIDTTGNATDGILLNSVASPGVTNGGIVILEPGNASISVISAVTTDPGKIPVHMMPAPVMPGATLYVGAVTKVISDTAPAVFTENSDTIINNEGLITAFNSTTGAIQISKDGINTTINNGLGGQIGIGDTINGPFNVIGIYSDVNAAQPTLTLNNDGLVMSAGKQSTSKSVNDAIQLNSPFLAINNNLSGQIVTKTPYVSQATSSIALNLFNANGGSIINKGLISNGSIGVGPGTFEAIRLNTGSIDILDNSGWITVDPQVVLTKQNQDPAITLNGNVTTFINSGTIESQATTATITSSVPNVVITNGLVNSGFILNHGAFPVVAIDFTTSSTFAAVTQTDGVILGNVLLGAKDGSLGSKVFTMSGGQIDGDVIGATAQANIFQFDGGYLGGNLFAKGGAKNTLNLTGGMIAGTVTLGTFGDTVNMDGTKIVGLVGDAGDDIVNITAGDYVTLDAAGGTANELNFNDSVTTSGFATNFQKVTINIPGTVVHTNGQITNISQMTVNKQTQLYPTQSLIFVDGATVGLDNFGITTITDDVVFSFSTTGDLTNRASGRINIEPTGQLFIQEAIGSATPIPLIVNTEAGSTVNFQLQGPINGPVGFGRMDVATKLAGTSVNLIANSFIEPTFYGFIPNNDVYPIITVHNGTGATITDKSSLVQPHSAVVYFTKQVDNSIINGPNSVLNLTAHRHPYLSLSSSSVTPGIAGFLDFLAQGTGPSNNDFYTLLTAIDQLPTQAQVEATMQALTPPFNYGLVQASHMGMDNVFEGVTDRVWDIAWHHKDHGRRHSGKAKPHGVNAGDPWSINTTSGIWFRPFGGYATQTSFDGVAGYKAKAAGGAIGVDWGVTDCTTFGLAASFTNVNVDDKNLNPKNQKLKAWQGTVYGSYDFQHGIFFDAMFGLADNHYDQKRVISANNLLTAAQAEFNGTQWGVQADLGWALPKAPMFLAPFARLKFIHLDLDNYTETGASGLNLTVANQDLEEFMGGIGIKMAGDVNYRGIEWVPEMSAMFGYDFTNDVEQTLANFAAGGPAFTTTGIQPGKAMFDLGLALNALYGPNIVFTVKYNLEVRDKLFANSGYLQYFYQWS